ncbi:RNA polymerase sigma factor [Fictibacillus iocasae]|uniref:RNA polymerase sigma factor n=1 Tax=Fictibacillus iocasae TaxID=2715437 RepID=A0ABW2NQK2_9BACL
MTDWELIAEAKGGSAASQEILVRRYYKLVYTFLYRMTGEKELAMDLTQETFIKTLRQLDKYKPSSEFKSWLLTVAGNTARDHLKSKHHKEHQHTYELLDTDMKKEKSVASIFEKNEKRKEIQQALLDLPDFQREAILLKYYNDMKLADIASMTNTSVPTVKSRLKQGLGKLKIYLNRGECDEKRTN